jgi:hypothetical protein
LIYFLFAISKTGTAITVGWKSASKRMRKRRKDVWSILDSSTVQEMFGKTTKPELAMRGGHVFHTKAPRLI